MENLERVLRAHPFLAGLSEQDLEFMVGCAKNVVFKQGDFAFREGDPADDLFLLREGRLVLEVDAPGRGTVQIETLREGDVFGWSALVPPNRFDLDGRASERTRAIAFDGRCLANKFEADPRLGYLILRRLLALLHHRLERVRLQALDVYGGGR